MKTRFGTTLFILLFYSLYFTTPAYAADPLTIDPSGDTTGQTDADALQAALSNADPGAVIQLTEGTYYLNHVLLAENFQGTIQGAGREKTILTTVGELSVSPDVPVWKNPPSLSNPWPFVLTIVDGDVTVQGMTWHVTERVPMRFKYLGDFEIPALPAIIAIISGDASDAGKSLLQDVALEGAEGEFMGYNLIQLLYHEGLIDGPTNEAGKVTYQYPLRGEHRVSDASFKDAFAGNALFNLAADAKVTIEESTFVEVSEGIEVLDSGGTVIMTNNVITPTGSDGVGIIAMQGYFSVPEDSANPVSSLVKVQITGNTFYVDGGHAAVDLSDMQYAILGTPPSLDATVEENQIILTKADYGIIGYGMAAIQLRNNTISGSALYEGTHVSFATHSLTTLQPGDKAQLGAYGKDVLRRAPQPSTITPSEEITPTAEITPTSTTPSHVEITMTGAEKHARANPQEFAFYELPTMGETGIAHLIYKDDLSMEVYYPPNFDFTQPLPVVLFVNGVSGDYFRTLKSTGAYVSWSQLVAASGMIAVNYDISETADPFVNIGDVLHYLQANSAMLGVDPSQICLWASSANPRPAIKAMTSEEESYHDGLRCAVIYYGAVRKISGSFPQNFALLAVRAGKDDPGFSDNMNELTDWAQAEGVDVSIIDYEEGIHGFDIWQDTPRTREIIGQTLEFLKEQLQIKQ